MCASVCASMCECVHVQVYACANVCECVRVCASVYNCVSACMCVPACASTCTCAVTVEIRDRLHRVDSLYLSVPDSWSSNAVFRFVCQAHYLSLRHKLDRNDFSSPKPPSNLPSQYRQWHALLSSSASDERCLSLPFMESNSLYFLRDCFWI